MSVFISPVATFSLVAITLIMAGCESTPKQPTEVRKPQPTKQQETVVAVTQTAEALINEARNSWQTERDEIKRDDYLLDAAEIALAQGNRLQAQQLLFALKKSSLTDQQTQRLNLYIVESYLHDPKADEATLLTLLSPLAEDENIRQRQLEAQKALYEKQQQWLAAANTLVTLNRQTPAATKQVWTWVKKTDSQQRQQAESQYPNLEPYLALYNIAQTAGLDSQRFSQEIETFKHVYRGHPLVATLPDDIQARLALPASAPDDILVLLPLSGKLGDTGRTIKAGMLAAYYDKLAKNPQLHPTTLTFFDTVNKDTDALVDAISGYQWVVGPLLKENVDAITPYVPATTTLLALNRSDTNQDTQTLSPLLPVSNLVSDDTTATVLPEATLPTVSLARPKPHAFFALAPEDEARQLAQYIFHQGFASPIVVAAQSSINQRMKSAFEAQWQSLNASRDHNDKVKLVSVDFTDSNSLKTGITEALGVAQSRDRIRQIEYMQNEKLYNVPRNRRDVDGIIVFASPAQTELLNPMVEASLSPFNGKTVPVFATSRSIAYDDTKNQWRDLQNVRFLDMPWMMPENQWADFQATVKALWPRRNTQMSRLFAFGVDAYNLLPDVAVLMTLSQTQIEALTGALRIDKQGNIVRTLPQAVIQNQSVRPLTSSLQSQTNTTAYSGR
nr:penicillin-binding protein activator [Alteromonas sp. C1M14]